MRARDVFRAADRVQSRSCHQHGRRLGPRRVRYRGRGGDRGVGHATRARRGISATSRTTAACASGSACISAMSARKADGDLYGDGVNIAARLQALAEPGGIIVSEAVRGAVKNRVAAEFDDRGLQAVKNIADPVRAFSVRPEGSPKPTVAAKPLVSRRAPYRLAWIAAAGVVLVIGIATAAWLRPGPPRTRARRRRRVTGAPSPALSTPGKPSIAVLPFDNMSGDPSKAYFADGITEDLITDLSKVGGLLVIARNSTFAYKGKAHDVRAIAKALGVRYVLEGSVRRSGDDIRVNAQLIDAHDRRPPVGGSLRRRHEEHLRSAGQNRAQRGRGAFGELTRDDKARVASRGTGNAQAYDVFLKGWEHYLRADAGGIQGRDRRLQEGRGAGPELQACVRGPCGNVLGELHPLLGGHGHRACPRLAGTKPSSPLPRRCGSRHRWRTRWRARCSCTRSSTRKRSPRQSSRSRRTPTTPTGTSRWRGALSFAGRPADALEAVERAMRLNPHYPSGYGISAGWRNSASTASRSRLRRWNAPSSSIPTTIGPSACCWRPMDCSAVATTQSRTRSEAMTTKRQGLRDPLSIRARHVLVSVRQCGCCRALRHGPS